MRSYWLTGLTPDAVTFIATQCRCAHCGSSISASLEPCNCGKAAKTEYSLVAAFTRELDRDEWRRICDREAGRAKARRRAALIAAGGGALSAGRIDELLDVQERRCYFCASPLMNADGSRNFHRDHFEPLALGGSSTVHNMVLTCPRCNIQKNDMSGDMFEPTAKKLRSLESSTWLREMRKRLKQWRQGIENRP